MNIQLNVLTVSIFLCAYSAEYGGAISFLNEFRIWFRTQVSMTSIKTPCSGSVHLYWCCLELE